MGVLAQAGFEELREVLASVEPLPEYYYLRTPEVGMVMVRARADGTGDRFHLGEMTMTRCVVKTSQGVVGHGYVAGRDKRHAELAAIFDALLQCPKQGEELLSRIIDPLARKQKERRRAQATKTAATRVNFFTLVRGKDEG